ncbi:MAG: hypothetical protein MI922_05175 [Bacteroidales bacterium]|nr:hypothetical protein [Bacteroidales bacterium]
MKICYLTVALLLFVKISFSLDVVEVSEFNPAVLEYGSEVTSITFKQNPIVDISNNQANYRFYNFEIHGKVLVIFTNKANSPDDTITIELKDQSKHEYLLKNVESPANSYYNYLSKVDKPTGVQNKLNALLAEQGNDHSFVAHDSKIFFVISDVRSDKYLNYFKAYIVNKSSKDYVIDEVLFMEIGISNSLIQRKEVVKSTPVKLIYAMYPEEKNIAANTQEQLGFVIPKHDSENINGKMVLQFMERDGRRNAVLEIPIKEINKILTN